MTARPLLTVTLGDPFSVNVEVLAKAWPEMAASDIHVWLIGSRWQWQDQLQRLGLNDPVQHYVKDPSHETHGLSFWDLDDSLPAAAQGHAAYMDEHTRGLIAVRSLEALRRVRPSAAWAVVTMPINKYRAAQAGFLFPGQTEYMEALWEEEAVMLLAGPRLRVGLATNHLALRDVPMAVNGERVVKKLTQLTRCLREVYGVSSPRIAVAALNPHGGDRGLFGDEDERLVKPAVAEAQAVLAGAQLSGPWPSDTVFHRAFHGEFDAVLALYHDQGLGPLKLVHFHDAVNVSGGMRYLRLSPDHGPAENLFLTQQADATSCREALRLACDYLRRQRS